jgi:hypothetical protein
MRFTISLPRPKFWQALIAALLVANLVFTGARALADDSEGGNPPPFPHEGFHLGCVSDKGDLRVFLNNHATYGTTPQDSCQPNERRIRIFIGHE